MKSPNPFAFFCELIDTSTGEILRSEFTRGSPLTGDHGIAGCKWRSVEVAPVVPVALVPPVEPITDEGLAKRLLHAKTGVSASAWVHLHEHERTSWLDAAKTARESLLGDSA